MSKLKFVFGWKMRQNTLFEKNERALIKSIFIIASKEDR